MVLGLEEGLHVPQDICSTTQPHLDLDGDSLKMGDSEPQKGDLAKMTGVGGCNVSPGRSLSDTHLSTYCVSSTEADGGWGMKMRLLLGEADNGMSHHMKEQETARKGTCPAWPGRP